MIDALDASEQAAEAQKAKQQQSLAETLREAAQKNAEKEKRLQEEKEKAPKATNPEESGQLAFLIDHIVSQIRLRGT